jgi:hypothetical protein
MWPSAFVHVVKSQKRAFSWNMRMLAAWPLLLLASPAHGFSGAGRALLPLHRCGCDRGGQGGARVAPRIRMEEASTTLGGCKYDHLQFFVDELRPLSHYKAIEDRLNEFARLVPRAEGAPVDIAAARGAWRKMGRSADPDAFEARGYVHVYVAILTGGARSLPLTFGSKRLW